MGWIGNILIWIGLFLVGKKSRNAFLWTIAGELIWVFYAAVCGWWDLAVSCIVFVALASNNWREWGVDAGRRKELIRKESRMNHNGFYLRSDYILREGEKWAEGAEEGYSLVSFGPFEIHHIFGGDRDWAVEMAYEHFINMVHQGKINPVGLGT